MNANKLVKKYGLIKCKAIVGLMNCGTVNYEGISVDYNDLKRIVESHELVESHGGLPQSRELAHENCFEYPMRLLQAIVDVESCL